MGIGDVSGSGGICNKVEACMICDDGEMGVGRKFCQGSTCFGPWIPSGLVHFVGFGGVSGSGGIWVKVEACLAKIGGEGGFG